MITLVCTDVRLTHHQTRFHPRSRTAAVETVAAPQAVLSSIQRQLEPVRLCFRWPAFSLLPSSPFPSLPEWVKYSTDYLFTSSSKNLLLLFLLLTALMTLNLCVCVRCCFQFFYISTIFTFSLILCFLSLFRLFGLSLFSAGFHAFEVLLLWEHDAGSGLAAQTLFWVFQPVITK